MFRNGKFYLPILKDSKFLSKKENFHNICESCTILKAYFLHLKKENKTSPKAIGVSVFQYAFSKIQHLLKKRKKRAPQKECSFAVFWIPNHFKNPFTMCSSASASVSPKVISLMSCSPAILPMAAS